MPDPLLTHFLDEWTYLRGLTVELLASLSDEELRFQPGATLGPFWKQFRHAGRVQEDYLDALDAGRVHFSVEGKHYHGGPARAALLDYLSGLDARTHARAAGLRGDELVRWGPETLTPARHLLRLASHETLHHGQWAVYVRLLGRPFPPGWGAWGLAG